MLKRATNAFKADTKCPLIPLEPREDEGNEIAVLACGEFFAPRERFQKLEGVERVILGYTGGKKREIPTHHKIHDHSEALLIEFDPKKLSFRDILEVWHECDNPWEPSKSKQYQSAVFWKSLKQQDEALNFTQQLQAKNPSKTLHTAIERIYKFYKAKQPCREIPLTPKREGNDVAIVACGNFIIPKDRFEEVSEKIFFKWERGNNKFFVTHKSMFLYFFTRPKVLSEF